MAAIQELRDLIAELTRQLTVANEALILLEQRANEQEDEDADESEEEDTETEETDESEEEEDDVPEPQDNEAEVNQGLAEQLRRLNFGHQTRSRVQTINGIVLATGFGYDGDTYTSARGNVFDMTRPPPRDCFNCGGKHWRKDCPKYYQ